MPEDEKTQEQPELFAVYAESEGHGKPLILIKLSFGRLIDEIVVPYQRGDTFFIDGVPVSPKQLERIKIVRMKPFLSSTLGDLHRYMRHGDIKRQELYGKQYHVRLEALLRESGDDVTAQVISAYDHTIKPRLKDYILKRPELIAAAFKIFTETLRMLSDGQPSSA